MDNIVNCAYCGARGYLLQHERTIRHRGADLTVMAYFYRCPTCKKEWTTDECDNENLKLLGDPWTVFNNSGIALLSDNTTTMKLDNYSKIILAIGNINYLSSSVNDLLRTMRLHGRYQTDEDFRRQAVELEVTLGATAIQLNLAMQNLGNLANSIDLLCPLDVYVTSPAFFVVGAGFDETEAEYPVMDAPYDKSVAAMRPVHSKATETPADDKQ